MSVPGAKDAARLRHVVEACDRVGRYVDQGRGSLDAEVTYDAVLMCLTIIGEALGSLSETTYARLDSVPPGSPKAMRNLVVHEYWRVDPDTVWKTVRALPALRDEAFTLLEAFPPSGLA